MSYVIGRLEPDHRSGCVYWSGTVSVNPDTRHGTSMLIGEAINRHTVLIIEDADRARGLALWLNTSPALVHPADGPRWQAMPLPEPLGGVA